MDIDRLAETLSKTGPELLPRVAAKVAGAASPEDLKGISRLLLDPRPAVRMAAMEILAEARYEPARRVLLAVASKRQGAEAQRAAEIAARLGGEAAPSPAPGWQDLLQRMLAAPFDRDRIALVQEAEQRPPEELAQLAVPALERGGADLATLLARALTRRLSGLDREALRPLGAALQRARSRFAGVQLARLALDDCLTTLLPPGTLPGIVIHMGALEGAAAERLGRALAAAPVPELQPLVPTLVGAVQAKPSALLAAASALLKCSAALTRAEKAILAEAIPQTISAAQSSPTPERALAQLGELYALVVTARAPTPSRLLAALDAVGGVRAGGARVAILRRLETEEAAQKLVEMTRWPEESVREAAREALLALVERGGPNFRVEAREADEWVVHPVYRSSAGETLEVGAGFLRDVTGALYALDREGEVMAVDVTAWGACRCCTRPRVLERRQGERPVCPITGYAHLRDKSETLLEREHPLGGCDACETLTPLRRRGDEVYCPDCGREHKKMHGRWVKKPKPKQAFVGDSRPGDGSNTITEENRPEPPSQEQLDAMDPVVSQVMASTIFLVTDDKDHSWFGSGIVVARRDLEVVILTNRHVVEHQDEHSRRFVEVRAMTIGGEIAETKLVWAAQGGVDLAILTARLREPERVTLTPIGDAQAKVGEKLFGVGAPIGLSWTYGTGDCAAVRRERTEEGVEVEIVQSQLPMGPGSSGGGIFNGAGELVAVQHKIAVFPGQLANLGLSIQSVRKALIREKVKVLGKRLVRG